MSFANRILCPVDFSECSAVALRAAFTVAERLGARLDVLHAYHVPHFIQPSLLVWLSTGPRPLWEVAEEQAKSDLEAFVRDALGDRRPADLTVVHAEAVAAVTAAIEKEKYDLVVLGTHGRTGVPRLVVGSVAEGVVRHAACPVVTVPTRANRG